MDRPHPGPDGGAGTRTWASTPSPPMRGRERDRVARQAAPLQRHDPPDQPRGAGRRGAGPAAAEPDGEEGAARPPVGGAEGARVGLDDRRHVDGPQHGDEGRRASCSSSASSRSGPRSPRTSRCCTCSSTCTRPAAWSCCSTPRAAPRRAASWAARRACRSRWRSAWATRWWSRVLPCAGSSTGARAVVVHADGRRPSAPAAPWWRSPRRWRAGSSTTRRCRATATSSPSGCRWARWPSAWPSTTSPSGARRVSAARRTSDVGPVKLTFDNSPPDGSPGVLLGFLEGRAARETGRLAPEERRALVIDCFTRLFGPRAAQPGALRRAPVGRGGVLPRVLRLPPAHGRVDELRRGAAGADRARCTGPGRRSAEVWSGYMDGAVRSGETAAREVLAAL